MFPHRRLFSLWRNGFEEVSVYGEIVLRDAAGLRYRSREWVSRYPARSLLKPFQFLAAGLPEERWAGAGENHRYTAALGSISATAEQVAALEAWYRKGPAKAVLSRTQVPPSLPMDAAKRVAVKISGGGPRPLYHTCFSKHAAILEACESHGWDPASYRSPDHPFHRALMATLSELLDRDMSEVAVVTDGCGLPSPVLSLSEMALLFQRLAAAPEGTRLGHIRRMMLTGPEWIGGPGRVDTALMRANPGRVVAKEGADGLLGIGILPSERYPEGMGLVLKLTSGDVKRHAALALAPLLTSLGLEGAHRVPEGQEIRFHYAPGEGAGIPLLDISPVISPSIAVWPGDQRFERVVSMDTAQGQHLTLSHITTTLHVGAHADAPNHYERCPEGIDQADLHRYFGAAQVVKVEGRPERILPSHLEDVRIQAPRVLFRTGSFPDPDRFSENFTALSAEVVRHLAAQGVTLVGIDTPSVDPFDSKDLPAHRALRETGMANLEGLVLSDVAPGLYHLVALPLALRDADASPVRAVLIPV